MTADRVSMSETSGHSNVKDKPMTNPAPTVLPVADALDAVLAAQQVTTAAAAAERDARASLVVSLGAARTLKHTSDTGAACRLEQRGPSVTVANDTQYRAWVRANHPGVMRDVVDPSWQRTHLAIGKGVDVTVTADGDDVVDTATGELVPGVRVQPPPPARLVVTSSGKDTE